MWLVIQTSTHSDIEGIQFQSILTSFQQSQFPPKCVFAAILEIIRFSRHTLCIANALTFGSHRLRLSYKARRPLQIQRSISPSSLDLIRILCRLSSIFPSVLQTVLNSRLSKLKNPFGPNMRMDDSEAYTTTIFMCDTSVGKSIRATSRVEEGDVAGPI